MQDLLKNVEIEKKLQIKLRRKITNALKNSTPGSLRMKGKYYYWSRRENGVYSESYLGKEDNQIVQRLKRKRYLQTALKTIDRNLKAIEKFETSYKPYDPISLSEGMATAYQIPPDSIFSIMEIINPKDWQRVYKKSCMFPEFLTQVTDKGERVRSKSEVIIANALSTNDIEFQYECNQRIGCEWVSPDFQIFLPRKNRIVIWEHFGRADDPEYLDRAMHKIKLYIDNGYVLWHDLIITFEDKNGGIDSNLVSKIIEACLL